MKTSPMHPNLLPHSNLVAERSSRLFTRGQNDVKYAEQTSARVARRIDGIRSQWDRAVNSRAQRLRVVSTGLGYTGRSYRNAGSSEGTDAMRGTAEQLRERHPGKWLLIRLDGPETESGELVAADKDPAMLDELVMGDSDRSRPLYLTYSIPEGDPPSRPSSSSGCYPLQSPARPRSTAARRPETWFCFATSAWAPSQTNGAWMHCWTRERPTASYLPASPPRWVSTKETGSTEGWSTWWAGVCRWTCTRWST